MEQQEEGVREGAKSKPRMSKSVLLCFDCFVDGAPGSLAGGNVDTPTQQPVAVLSSRCSDSSGR